MALTNDSCWPEWPLTGQSFEKVERLHLQGDRSSSQNLVKSKPINRAILLDFASNCLRSSTFSESLKGTRLSILVEPDDAELEAMNIWALFG